MKYLVYPPEIRSWLVENNYEYYATELTKEVNKKFGTSYSVNQIRAFRKNNHLRCIHNGRFTNDQTSWCKGKKWDEIMPKHSQNNCMKTCFKKGQFPHNRVPIGTIVMRPDGYSWIKIQDGHGVKNFKQLHYVIYEQAYGPIPDGMIVTFRDQDKSNFSLDNLVLITHAENARLMNYHLRLNPELIDMALDIVRLEGKAKELMKGKK